jgi:sugar phosphate isomerase/epimerase
MTFAPTRRRFIQTSAAYGAALAAVAGTPGVASAQSKPLPFRYAYSAISWETNIEEAVKVGEKLGFPGVEPFRHNIVNYLDKPLALKKFMTDHHIQMATCSNGGGPNFSGNFVDPDKIDQSVKDHINFARTFIAPFGYCKHFKMNMGPRPAGYDTNDEQIKRCADAMNRIGKETIKMGLKLAPHPHVNSLVQNQHEVDLLMKETDPAYVWLTADTSHLVLGGLVPMEVLSTYWPRIAAIHYKGAPTKLKGNRKVAVPRTGDDAGGHGWFRSMSGPDSGGVDFPAIQKYLVEKNYSGWVTLDYDASMIPKGSTMEALLAADKKYIIDVLKVDPKEI